MWRVFLIGMAIGQTVRLCIGEHYHDAVTGLMLTAILALEWKVSAQASRMRDAGL